MGFQNQAVTLGDPTYRRHYRYNDTPHRTFQWDTSLVTMNFQVPNDSRKMKQTSFLSWFKILFMGEVKPPFFQPKILSQTSRQATHLAKACWPCYIPRVTSDAPSLWPLEGSGTSRGHDECEGRADPTSARKTSEFLEPRPGDTSKMTGDGKSWPRYICLWFNAATENHHFIKDHKR